MDLQSKHEKFKRHGSITVSEFGYFLNFRVFCGKKIVLKTNLGSTKHYILTSYHKYFLLCMVFRGVAAQINWSLKQEIVLLIIVLRMLCT